LAENASLDLLIDMSSRFAVANDKKFGICQQEWIQ